LLIIQSVLKLRNNVETNIENVTAKQQTLL